MRDDHIRGFRVEVETDSTIYPDENAEKASRNEFIGVMSQFLQQAAPMAQTIPSSMPLIEQMILFVLRGYRVGREMEATITQSIQAMGQEMAQKAKTPPEPDPIDVGKLEYDKERIAIENKKVDGDLQIRQQEVDVKKDQMGHTKEDAGFQRQLSMLQELNTIAGDEGLSGDMDPEQMAAATGQPAQPGPLQMILQALTAPRRTQLIIDPETGDPVGAESQVVTGQ